VLYAAADAQVTGGWAVVADSTAAGGARLQNADAGQPKLVAASSSPAQSFELSFNADAARPYRLWLRSRAAGNSYTNDSVFVQFDGSVDAAGKPVWRTNTTEAAVVSLEDCGGCGVSGWGWSDNGYGTGVLGPTVYFATSGRQRVRIQVREDGIGIDQVVLSAARYLTERPGATKDDRVVIPK
jgi:hypothetical protein